MESLKDKAVIVGVGESQHGRVPLSSLGLCAQAARDALDDAGLTKADIDAVLTTESYVKPYNRHGSQFGEYFGFPYGTRYLDSCVSGSGLAGGYGVHYAAAFVASGLCDTVMVCVGDNIQSSHSRDNALQTISENYEREFGIPYGPIVATRFAWMARRHMYQYGTTPEQLASVAVATRKWAILNPKAEKRRPVTVEEVLSSKMISSPLHILDCSLVSDGAAAVIVTRPELARGLKKAPIYVKGIGASFGNAEFVYDDITNLPDLVDQGSRLAADRAFEMAGRDRSDIDLLYLYDCFSIMVLLELENLGFCEPGQSGPTIADMRTAPGGDLPVNTHGGLMSYSHPAKPGGMFMFVEAVRQLRGEVEQDRQVKNAELAIVKGQMAHCAGHPVTILGSIQG